MMHSPREYVIKAVRDWIKDGQFSEGMMIPGEDEISRRLRVARGTVRSGLELLEEEGVLQKRNRRRYVAGNRKPVPRALSLIKDTILVFGGYGDNGMAYKNTGFHQAIQAGVFERLTELGKHVININIEKLSDAEMRSILDLRPEGVVVLQYASWSLRGTRLMELLQSEDIPVVTDYYDRNYPEMRCVLPDHEQGNYELVKFLIGRGFRKIMCFYPDNTPEYWFNARHQGYRRAMLEHGLPLLPHTEQRVLQSEYEHTQKEFDSAVRQSAGYLVESLIGSECPDAILVGTDWEVPIVSAACKLFGKSDIVLAGFDNRIDSHPWKEWNNTIPLASMDKHNTLIGRRVVDHLMLALDGKNTALPRCELVKPDLVVFDNQHLS